MDDARYKDINAARLISGDGGGNRESAGSIPTIRSSPTRAKKQKEANAMSKEPIYRIKIEVIGTEDEKCKIDETLRGGVDCSGFVILCDKGDDTSTAILHHVSNIDVACAIAGSGELMAASLIAQAMREGRKLLREERSPLADLIKAMSK